MDEDLRCTFCPEPMKRSGYCEVCDPPWWKDRLARAWYLVSQPVVLLQWLTRTEWSELWRMWPHCLDQGQCWMHMTTLRAWCRCRCAWCRMARQFRAENCEPKP